MKIFLFFEIETKWETVTKTIGMNLQQVPVKK